MLTEIILNICLLGTGRKVCVLWGGGGGGGGAGGGGV